MKVIGYWDTLVFAAGTNYKVTHVCAYRGVLIATENNNE